MFGDLGSKSGFASGISGESSRRLSPVLARARELGRGSPALMRWLERKPTTSVAGLASELDRVVRRAGVLETIRV
ncbi:MAG TPA: hypothetical protein VHR66_08095 [Gemmataceae bacterium]|jgi:hypothetical protein|nr:hypothetical protein [Gemmataceae bacterium]